MSKVKADYLYANVEEIKEAKQLAETKWSY